jgi:hypothetical protein
MVSKQEQDRRLERMDVMEEGREASIVASVVVPLINTRITNYVQQLSSMYRGGQYNHDMLLGKVAEITAMLNLISDLESKQRRGDVAAQKEMGDGS